MPPDNTRDNAKSVITLPQVPEAHAPAHIAAIYTDIRAVSGIPVVNLIWRHFAALPGVLPWAWAAVAPLVASASMDDARERLASAIALPDIEAPGRAAWERAGVNAADLQAIRALNEAYIRGNLTNILALTSLRLRLEHPEQAAAHLKRASAAIHVPPPLPPLPRIDELDAGLADRCRALAGLHRADGVIPSLYLALAPWPGVVAALPDWLGPLYDPAALMTARATTCREAEDQALLPQLSSVPDGVQLMMPALQLFTSVVIPDLIAVGFALRCVLPSDW